MIFLQPNFILAGVLLFAFYAMGKEEAKHGRRDLGMIWALYSAIVSGVVIGAFAAGWLPVLLAQVGLFIAIALVRLMLEKS